MKHTWLPLVLLIAACAEGAAGPHSPVATGGSSFQLGVPLLAPGLRSAVPGSGEVHVVFEAGGAGLESALFLSTDRAALFAGSPLENLADGIATWSGLVDGVEHFVGFGLRAEGESEYLPTGAVLSIRPGRPIFVDVDADPAGADGLSPATAYPDPILALLDALVMGGANLWVAAGEYEVANLPIFPGVHVYGGFEKGFDPRLRDPNASPTRWVTASGGRGLGLQGPGSTVVLDGLGIEGVGLGSIGIDIVGISAELRRVQVDGFTDRGVRVRNGTGTDLDLTLVDCGSSNNGGDGLSISGPMDVFLDASSFLLNGQEGVELDALVALEGDTARLSVRGSLFAGNGSEGLDADLDAPLLAGSPPGRFAIQVQGSRFEANGLDGLLIDLDFENAAGWEADVLVTDSRARANGASGIHVDADAVSALFLHRITSSSNGGDGVLISSETQTGLALVGTSVLSANLGAGLRATFGRFTPLLSHCVLAGNQGGGILSDTVTGVASSSVFWLQPEPLRGAHSIASPMLDDPGSPPFLNAGESFHRVRSISGASVSVSNTEALPANAILELADDGTVRELQGFTPGGITLTEAVEGVRSPASLVSFPVGASVEEDYGLVPGSQAASAGLTMPGAPGRDAGPGGSPRPGPVEGTELVRGALFRFTQSLPAPAVGLASAEAIELTFSEALDPGSVVLDAVRVLDAGRKPVPAMVLVEDDRLTVLPPPSGWTDLPIALELHAEISSVSGEPLAFPCLIVYPAR